MDEVKPQNPIPAVETEHVHASEKMTRRVVYLTALMMVFEISFGYWTNSMALLADGWHMASHVFAIGLTWIAYIVTRRYAESEKFSFTQPRLLALAGFTSAVVLQVVAVLMGYESVLRLLNPIQIKFGEAIIVAVIGLGVNAVSAYFLHSGHEHDHNIRSAYWHVLADGLTSVTAIIALTGGALFNLYFLDSLSGIISSVIITKWAIDLIRASGGDLIDFVRGPKPISKEAEVVNAVIKRRRSIYPNQYDPGKKIPDEIIWQILENANRAPNHKQTEPWQFCVFTGDGLR
ncbi:MAG: cation diffusion facilitator family transporter, partial [Pyrinomonadaceae bacterium]